MSNLREKFDRPQHQKDDGHAHIKFGQDPKPNLNKYGYCVVENVFTHKECDETVDEMWKWLEGLGTGIKRNDKTISYKYLCKLRKLHLFNFSIFSKIKYFYK